jgi:hypothetical protein
MADRTERAVVGRLELSYETFGDTDNPPLLLIAGLATQMLGWDDGSACSSRTTVFV